MKQSEFRRWLRSQGVKFKEVEGHTKAYLNGKQTVVPRHPAKELKDGTRRAILKQLGLD
ncbi:type II toxin-antitoxin system HicA family toxin [Delftia sp. PS-11]|uniref:type II toxin-antitoxin system HicA family toxin n=1 Tax=Delftia sp. PS-11 TaxID=2767222 RepID=UPI002457CFAF|nr:type II toxin-antitoxin system HicA family toxin [Delftia sp. PS-11]KAJ8743703.1 type II toxin-antitoxin system HicA family toxin [Delftia sp. PS-11]